MRRRDRSRRQEQEAGQEAGAGSSPQQLKRKVGPQADSILLVPERPIHELTRSTEMLTAFV
jgi:hypothetical protein